MNGTDGGHGAVFPTRLSRATSQRRGWIDIEVDGSAIDRDFGDRLGVLGDSNHGRRRRRQAPPAVPREVARPQHRIAAAVADGVRRSAGCGPATVFHQSLDQFPSISAACRRGGRRQRRAGFRQAAQTPGLDGGRRPPRRNAGCGRISRRGPPALRRSQISAWMTGDDMTPVALEASACSAAIRTSFLPSILAQQLVGGRSG